MTHAFGGHNASAAGPKAIHASIALRVSSIVYANRPHHAKFPPPPLGHYRPFKNTPTADILPGTTSTSACNYDAPAGVF